MKVLIRIIPPVHGHRFNPAKLLLDPYAKAIAGTVKWSDALFGYPIGDPEGDLIPDKRDSAEGLPKCVVIHPAFSGATTLLPKRRGIKHSFMSFTSKGLPRTHWT
jgi:isoamylase